MCSSRSVRAAVLGLVCATSSCGGGNDKPRDAGGDQADASAHDAHDALDAVDSADAPPACVPVADQAISEVAGASGRPSLAWTGDGYGVVWPDNRGGVSQIYFAQLDRRGAKIGADRPVTATATDADFPAITWSGQAFGMAFVTESATPPMMHFARLATDGTLQGTVGDVGEGVQIPSIVSSGQTFAVAYYSARGAAMNEIFMSRFDASGARVGTELQLTSNNGFGAANPSIAWTGSRYGISFQDSRGPETEVFLALVDANGEKIGQEAQLTVSNGAGKSYIAASSTGFAVTYPGLAPTLIRMDSAGTRTTADVQIGLTPAPIVWNGTRYAFVSAGTAGGKVFLSTIEEGGAAPTAPVLVSASNANSLNDSIGLVWNGNGYGVVWIDFITGTPETHFATVCP